MKFILTFLDLMRFVYDVDEFEKFINIINFNFITTESTGRVLIENPKCVYVWEGV